jgi:hypothetical protein
LASINFSEVRSANKKCRMKALDLAAQLRNLGLNSRASEEIRSCRMRRRLSGLWR